MNLLARRFPMSRQAGLALVALVAVLALAGPASGEDVDPFRRPAPTSAAGPTPPSPLDTIELRGVSEFKDVTLINLYNPTTSKSINLRLGDTVDGITVTDYQSADDSVLLRSGGRERRVQVNRKVQIVTMVAPPPVAAPPPGVPAVAGGPPPPPGTPGAMGDEEVRIRMQRVAEEIKRRREMRREIMERSGQQQPQPGQPQQ